MKNDELYQNEEFIVQNFLFVDEAELELAKSEIKKIEYIEERVDYNNVKMIYNFYNNCVENKIFVTPIGYNYMEKTRKFILESGYSDHVLPIPVASNNHIAKRELKRMIQREEQLKKEKDKLIVFKRLGILLNVVLFILIIAMFFIASTSNKPNIINYEKAIVNKYATWDEELSERENAIRKKELELSIGN